MINLQLTNWRAFAGELVDWCNEWSFSRGLVHSVAMTPGDFVKHGQRVFSRHPVQLLEVKAPRFTAKQLERVVTAPGIPLVKELLAAQASVNAFPRLPLAALAKGRRFDSLRTLRFRECGCSGDDWRALFMELEAPRLDAVVFTFNDRSYPELWHALASGPGFGNLKTIVEVFDGPVHTSNAGAFVDAFQLLAEHRPKLEALSLRAAYVDDAVLAPLFAKSSRVILRELTLNDAPITDETLKLWQRDGAVRLLESLTVLKSRVTAEGLANFLDSNAAPKLEQFVFSERDTWTEREVTVLRDALLRVPEGSPLKKISVGSARAAEPMWHAVRERFEVQ